MFVIVGQLRTISPQPSGKEVHKPPLVGGASSWARRYSCRALISKHYADTECSPLRDGYE